MCQVLCWNSSRDHWSQINICLIILGRDSRGIENGCEGGMCRERVESWMCRRVPRWGCQSSECVKWWIQWWLYQNAAAVSRPAVSDSLWPHGLQPARLLCPWVSQARVLEWGARPSSRASSQARDQTRISCLAGRLLTSKPPGKPSIRMLHTKGSELRTKKEM